MLMMLVKSRSGNALAFRGSFLKIFRQLLWLYIILLVEILVAKQNHIFKI